MAFRFRFPTPKWPPGLLILVVLALQLSGGAGLWPAWARAWSGSAAWPVSIGYAKPLTLADFSRISLWPSKTAGRPNPTTLSRSARGRESGTLEGIFDVIRETELRQNGAALADWARYYEESSARKMAAARLVWEERFRDRAIRLGVEQDQLLADYAAEVRREYYSIVSALEMQIAMCEDPQQKPLLEAQLSELLAQIEAKIAQRHEGLSRQCALELESLRNQAREALAQLEIELREESRQALAEFAAAQGKDYSIWLARSKRAEESARQARASR